MSERLRRWIRNPLGSARRGSNPLAVVIRLSLLVRGAVIAHQQNIGIPVAMLRAMIGKAAFAPVLGGGQRIKRNFMDWGGGLHNTPFSTDPAKSSRHIRMAHFY